MSKKRPRISDASSSDEDVAASMGVRLFKTDRRTCPHCQQLVSKKTYKTHKRPFYNENDNSWMEKESQLLLNNSSESEDETPPSSQLNSGVTADNDSDHLPPDGSPDMYALDSEEESSDASILISEPEEELWDYDVADDIPEPEEDSEPEDNEVIVEKVSSQSSVLARWLTLFLFRMQTLYHISDKGIACFFKFLWAFFAVTGRFSQTCAEIAKCFPSSLYKARKIIDQPYIRRYVVCRKCHSLYFKKDCIFGAGTALSSKNCPFQMYPSHPQQRMRAPCGLPLLKTVELSGGNRILYPYMTCCYLSLECSIQALFNRPNFHSDIEKWRSRHVINGTYADIYDGKLWKEFHNWGGKAFLSEPYNLALSLNFDFFQPYKHIQYSVGAVYLTVLNLPRTKRYKQENVILLGLIPGPHEPKHDINSYTRPLVDELLRFWNGVDLNY